MRVWDYGSVMACVLERFTTYNKLTFILILLFNWVFWFLEFFEFTIFCDTLIDVLVDFNSTFILTTCFKLFTVPCQVKINNEAKHYLIQFCTKQKLLSKDKSLLLFLKLDLVPPPPAGTFTWLFSLNFDCLSSVKSLYIGENDF